MTKISGYQVVRGCALAIVVGVTATFAYAQDKTTTLFKIVSAKDEIVIGLNADELGKLGGTDAGAVARALKANGTLTAWQYAVKKAANGDLQQAPLHKVGVMAHDSIRIEPYKSPLAVLPHE